MQKSLGPWLVALFALVAAASSLSVAQVQVPRFPGEQPAAPVVLSGENFGFRVESTDPATGRPMGRIVVRFNDGWVEVGFAPAVRRVQ
jgi:hypothetical protein